MCSRYQSPDAAEMARFYRVGLPTLPEIKPTIYPGYTCPVLLDHDGSGARIEARFWGFVLNLPGKRDPSKLVPKILQNAVSETVAEKRTFAGAWKNGQRCILPVLIFFEPVAGQFKGIHSPSASILSMAGIWSDATYREEKKQACTMLTCAPNAFVSKFHDRMPVILAEDDVAEWLSVDTSPEQAHKLCRPFQGDLSFHDASPQEYS